MATYVRFETPYRCETNGQPLGVFRAVPCLRERVSLTNWAQEMLDGSLDWFNEHLPVPESGEMDRRAIFWFHRPSEIVREMWYLVWILREEGLHVKLRRTSIPGRIVYRDDFQVAAIPYGDGLRRWRA